MRNKYKNYRLNNKGFSLIEILVALSIFSLIIGGVVLFSVRTIQAHTKSQAMQNAIDNARFAIESMNKKIRTSHDINSITATAADELVYIVDNVDAAKYCYQFEPGNTLTVMKITAADAAYDSVADCGDFTGSSSDIVGGGKIEVTGNFFVKETDEPAPAYKRGFVTTFITIQYNDPTVPPAERDSFSIQSSVSIRDY